MQGGQSAFLGTIRRPLCSPGRWRGRGSSWRQCSRAYGCSGGGLSKTGEAVGLGQVRGGATSETAPRSLARVAGGVVEPLLRGSRERSGAEGGGRGERGLGFSKMEVFGASSCRGGVWG